MRAVISPGDASRNESRLTAVLGQEVARRGVEDDIRSGG
jgi:hypothetical protein